MKRLLFLILFCFSFFDLIAQNFSLAGRYYPYYFPEMDFVIVKDNSITYEMFGYEGEIELSYKPYYEDGLHFFSLSDSFPKLNNQNLITTEPVKKMLILAGKQTSEDNSKNTFLFGEIIFLGEIPDSKVSGCYINSKGFCDATFRQYQDCSSYLREGNTEYNVENLCDSKPGTPWVEGVKGDGIGEGFTIYSHDKHYYRIPVENPYPYLLIMNGYISYEKPYLYKQNNRVKKIKVTGLSSGKSKVLDVLDTPHPQTVDISFITEAEDIRVEIADVYKGTKYDDTCMQLCITYSNKVIPYENSVR